MPFCCPKFNVAYCYIVSLSSKFHYYIYSVYDADLCIIAIIHKGVWILVHNVYNCICCFRSDVAWKYANYAQIWEYLRDEYELTQRFGSLDFKLKFVEVKPCSSSRSSLQLTTLFLMFIVLYPTKMFLRFCAAQHSLSTRNSSKQEIRNSGMAYHYIDRYWDSHLYLWYYPPVENYFYLTYKDLEG